MKKLSEIIVDLVHLLGKNKVQINYPWKESSKYQQYFDLINTSMLLETNKIAKKLKYKNSKDISFIRFQQRFENKLSFLIFTIDLEFENRSDSSQIAHNLILNYSQGKLLLQRGMRPTAMFYFNKAMIIARKTSFTEYEYLLNYEFYKYYSTLDFNKKKKNKYFEELNRSQRIMNAELQVKSYESELVALISKNVDKKLLIKKAKQCTTACNTITDKDFSYSIYITAFQISVFYFNLIRDYNSIFLKCESLAQVLKEKKFLTEASTYLIDSAYLDALISNYEFSKAKEFFKEITRGYKVGSHNYFSRMNKKFRILMRLKDYTEVMELTEEVFTQKTLPVFTRFNELWLIKKGSLHLLTELGVVENPTNSFNKISNYKLNKLLNQISIYLQDKTGQNAGLRVLEICFFIVRKSEEALIDRIESVRQYAYRYLRADNEQRFKIFFRFLITIYDKNYNVLAINRHSEELYQKLIENPQELSDSIVEAEIIPFEDLWHYMLAFIEKNYSQRV